MAEKTLPHNLEAEQNVLGSVFLDPNTVKPIRDALSEKDFFARRHRLIYRAIIDLHDEGVDIDYTTLTDKLETRKQLLDAGGADYILGLSDTTPSLANLEHYINIVRDKAVVRNMIEIARDVSEKGFTAKEMETYIDESERRIFNVATSRRTSDFVTLGKVTEEVILKTEEAKNKQGEILGLDTGYERLNYYTFGLQPTELYIIAARPSMGKSAFALNIATNVAKLKKRPYIAYFSLEMGVEQLVGRMLSAESNIDSARLRTGDLSSNEWQRLSVASDRLQKLNMLFDDSGTVKVTDLRQKCRKLKQEGRLDIVVIDYLQLLSGSIPQSNRVQEVSEISRTLKEMSRELKVPVIALSQLSRSVEQRTNKRPIMADLRESGSIEQDADVVLFLYREDYYNPKTTERPDIVDVMVAKNRSGATNVTGFPLIFRRRFSQFKTTKDPKHEARDIDLDDLE